MASRFAALGSDSKELQLRAYAIPEKTKSNTNWGMRVWTEWAITRVSSPVDLESRLVPTTPLLDMPPDDFAYWMGKFVLELRKQNGSEYPPKTLYALICCFKRFYEQNGVHDVNPLCSADARFGNF